MERPKHYSSEKQLPVIIRLVADANGVELSESTIERMEIIASACGIADDQVDRCENANKRKEIVGNALDYLFEEGELRDMGSDTYDAYRESMNNLKVVVDGMSEKRKQLFRLKLGLWARLSEERRAEEEIRPAIKERLVDLNVTGGVYLAATSDEERHNPNYRNLHKDFRRMVRVAGMIDDAMDLQDDYENGITQIEPSFANIARHVAVAVRHLSPMISYTLRPKLVSSSVDIMSREYRRRTTRNNYEQYNLDE
ncbi:hypothetical protein JXA63_04670 [Candidatus Woesebacteria bacterium]|nr:hypothetical protein [Candidatus Woesebacteria bacterium]